MIAAPTLRIAVAFALSLFCGPAAARMAGPSAEDVTRFRPDLVRPEEFRQPGDPDDTLSLQRAAATGRTVALADGKVYTICATIPGKRFIGLGTGATIAACRTWPAPPKDMPVFPVYAFLANPNWGAAEITDSDIVVENITFDGSNITFSNGGFHAVSIRRAQRVLASRLTCRNVGDCTAFLGNRETVVRDSSATGITNVAFDHWEGPVDALVERTRSVCAEKTPDTLGVGVMFTGASTDLMDRAGANLVSRRNHVSGPCTVGINANILSKGSSLSNVVSDGDSVDIGGHHGSGIIFTGNIRGGVIRNARIRDCNGGQGIAVTPDSAEPATKGGSGTPSNIRVVSPVVVDCVVGDVNVAPYVMLGTGNALRGAVLRGGRYPRSVWTDSPDTPVELRVEPTRP